jgi:hypothetical protein
MEMKSVLEKKSAFWSAKCVHCGHSRYDHDTHEKKCWSSSLQNNRCECPGFEPVKIQKANKVKKPVDLWKKNDIQFIRLIAELEMAGVFNDAQVMNDLRESMDLTDKQICEIVERASNKWDKAKEKFCPRRVK